MPQIDSRLADHGEAYRQVLTQHPRIEVLVDRMHRLSRPILDLNLALRCLDSLFHRPTLMIERFELFSRIPGLINQVRHENFDLTRPLTGR